MLCLRIVYILSMSSICLVCLSVVYVLSMCCLCVISYLCLVYVLFMSSLCYMSCLCLVYVLFISCLCLIYFLSTYTLPMSWLCLVYVLSIFCLCFVYVMSMSCLCQFLPPPISYDYIYVLCNLFQECEPPPPFGLQGGGRGERLLPRIPPPPHVISYGHTYIKFCVATSKNSPNLVIYEIWRKTLTVS